MEYLIVVCGAVGAWLLVAGPLYQASLELKEQEFDRDEIGKAVSAVPAPTRVSPWWWLLPPVAYVLQLRQQRAHQAAVMDALRPEQREQSVNFLNKAGGWLIVAAGAGLIAVKETFELVELFEWHIALFWTLIVIIPVLCVLFVVGRARQTARMLKKEQRPRQQRGRRA